MKEKKAVDENSFLYVLSFTIVIAGHILDWRDFRDTTDSQKDALTPWWALQYLLSLIYWRLMLQIIPNKYLDNKKLIIIAGFLPLGRVLSFQRLLSFMPFSFWDIV